MSSAPHTVPGGRPVPESERAERLRSAWADIYAAIRSTLDSDEIMQRALDAAVRTLGADAGAVEMCEGADWVVRFQAGLSAEEVGAHISAEHAVIAERVRTERAPIYLEDLGGALGRGIEFPAERDVRSVIATPIFVHGVVIGVVIVYFIGRAYSFVEADTQFVTALGALVSLAVDNARLVEAERHGSRLSAALSKINEILLSVVTTEDLIAGLVGEVPAAAGADKSLVIASDGDHFTITNVRNVVDDLVGVPKDAAFYPGFALAASSRRPVLIDDAWVDHRTNKDFVIPHGLRAFQLIPVVVDDRAVSVIAFAYDTPQHFDDEDEEFAERMSAAISLALRSVRLYESEVEARGKAKLELEHTQLLLEVAEALSSIGDLATKLETVAGLLQSAMRHKRVLVELWDEEDRQLRVAAMVGEPAVERRVYDFNELSVPAREAIEKRRTVTIDYTAQSTEAPERAAEGGFKLALAVPVAYGQHALGLIVVDQPQEVREFTEDEVEIVQGVAAEVASALEAARLFEAEAHAHAVAVDQARRLAVLKETAEIASSSLSVCDVGDRLARAVPELLAAKVATLMLQEAASDRLIPVGSFGNPDDYIARMTPAPEDSDVVDVFRADKSRWAEDLSTADISAASRARGHELGIGAFATLPLRAAGRVIGTFSVAWPRPRRISNRDREFLESFAAEAAAGLQNAQLFEELRESERRFRTLFETMGEGLVLADVVRDESGRFVDLRATQVNPAFEQQAGVPVKRVIGGRMFEAFPQTDGEWFTRIAKVVETGDPDHFQARFGPRGRWFEVGLHRMYEDRVAVLFFDVTDRKRAEQEIAEVTQRLEAHTNNSPLAVVEFDSEFRVIGWSDGAERMFGWSADEVVGNAISELRWVYEDDIPLVDAESERLLAGTAPRTFNVNRNYRKDGSVIWCEWYSSVIFDPDGIMISVRSEVLDITQRKEAEARLRSARALAEAERVRLRQIIDQIPMGLTLLDSQGEVLEVNEFNERIWAARMPKPAGPADYGVFEAFDHETGERIEGDAWPAVQTLATGETVSMLADIRRFDGSSATVRFTTTPVTDSSGNVTGAIGITEDVTGAVEAQRLSDALAGISTQIGSTLDTDDILCHVAEASADALCADSYALAVYGIGGWSISRSGRPLEDVSTSEDWLAEETMQVARQAFESGTPVVVSSGAESPPGDDATHALSGGSILALPIRVQNEAVCIALFKYEGDERHFTDEHREFGQELMHIATLALQNARLYERQHTIAQTLQEVILAAPRHVDGIDVAYLYRPAAGGVNVGGDFYDVFELEDGRVGIVVGDVAGKGIEAARLTSMLRDGVRAYAYELGDPAAVLDRVNNYAVRSSRVGEFATVFFAVLDPKTGEFVYASGGHPLAVLLRGVNADFLGEAQSALVGGFPDVRYKQASARMQSGDRLIMYTDAVIEARRDGEQFGEARLLSTIVNLRDTPTAQMPEALLGEVQRFIGGDPQDDVVILEVCRL